MGLDAIKAARAYVETVWNGDAVQRGLASLQHQIGALGGVSVNFGGIENSFSGLSNVMSLNESGFSQLSAATDHFGVSLGQLDSALGSQAKFLNEVASGSAAASESMGILGLSLKDVQSKSPDQQFLMLADAIAKVEDPITRVAIATEVFGEEGFDLLPVLEQGSDAIKAFGDEAKTSADAVGEAEEDSKSWASTLKNAVSIQLDAAKKKLDALQKALEDIGRVATDAGMKMMATGGAVVGFAGLAVAQFTQAGSAIDDMHQRTGIAVETLSELAYAAQMSGTSIESLESALVKQTKFLGDLQSGGKASAATLQQLGLSVEDLNGLSGDQAFGVLADSLANVDDEVLQTNLAMDIFGKGATELLPMIRSGAEGLDEMRQQARDLGLVMSGEDATAAAEFGDLLDQLWGQLGAATNQVGAALVPALGELISILQPLLTAGVEWLAQNDGIVVAIAAVASGVLAGGAALVTFGAAAGGVAAGLGAAVAVGTALAGVLGFILSPLGAVTAGVVALLATTVDWSAGWQFLVDTVGESLGLAVQLISNGEIDLAMQLLWAQIQTTWSQGVRWVVQTIGSFVTATIGALAAGIDKLGSMLDSTRNYLARQIAASGEFTGLLPEGTSEELLGMQEAGQVGSSALHGLAESLNEAGEGFQDLGTNVDELEAKLANLQRVSIDTNLKAELAKTEKAASKPQTGQGGPLTPQLDYTGGALGGTFSGNASRMLFSSSGETKTLKALGDVSAAVNKVEQAIRDAWGRVG